MPDLSEDGDAAAIAEFQKKLKETQTAEPAPGDDQEFEVGAPVTNDEPEPTRRERRQQRPALMEALEEEKERNRLLEERLARLESRSNQPAPPPPGPEPEDPHKARLERLDSELRSVRETFNAEWQTTGGKMSAERQKELQDRAERLQTERIEALADRRFEQRIKEQPQPNPHEAALRARHPEIFTDPKREMWAKGELQKLVAQSPPNDIGELHRLQTQALQAAEAHFGVDRRPDATDAERRRATGRRRGSSTGAPKTVKVDRAQRRLAMAMYEGTRFASLTDEQKIQKFVNEHLGKNGS